MYVPDCMVCCLQYSKTKVLSLNTTNIDPGFAHMPAHLLHLTVGLLETYVSDQLEVWEKPPGWIMVILPMFEGPLFKIALLCM